MIGSGLRSNQHQLYIGDEKESKPALVEYVSDQVPSEVLITTEDGEYGYPSIRTGAEFVPNLSYMIYSRISKHALLTEEELLKLGVVKHEKEE